MKKVFNLIFLFTGLLIGATSCDLFKIDNFDGPNAQVSGGIRDVLDNSLVETDLTNGSTMIAYELGQYSFNPEPRTWYIKPSGEYRNNLVFANTYAFDFQSCNFFPFRDTLDIQAGANVIDFTVTPYIRISNVSITPNATNTSVTATFRLAPGSAAVRLANISLYAFTDMYVGEYTKLPASRTVNQSNAVINTENTYSITIDVAANAASFGVHRNYYFRVAAKASLAGVGTIRANYAPYVVVPL